MNKQFVLPFTEKEEKYNKRDESPYKIVELRTDQHIVDMIRMSHEFTEDFDMEEKIDDVSLVSSCLSVCHDMNRSNLNVWLVYKNELAIGFLVGICYRTYYNTRIVAEQKLWFVSKKFRGTKAAYLLIKAYEQWARLNGATHIYTGTAHLRYAEQTKHVLEKLGYRHVGSLHVKEV